MSLVNSATPSDTSVPRRTSLRKVRTASSSLGSPIELAHPTPDLQSLQGAYVQNVERLEERAERMSCASSDLGEEIRKLQQEQKESDSRRASLYSNAVEPHFPPISSSFGHGVRSRNVSTSSYANSIVEVNSAARYGGYSPYSPIGSLRSGSWSQVSHPMSGMSGPVRSMSRRSSKFGMISTPEMGEGGIVESPKEARDANGFDNDDSSIQHTPKPMSKSNSNASRPRGSMEEDTRGRRMKRLSTGRLPSDGSFSELYNQLAEANRQSMDGGGTRIVSDTSFTDIYDQIAGEIKDTLDTSVMGAQEREMKRQSLAGTPPVLLPAFSEPQTDSSKPYRLSQTPPPLPPQHKELPQKEIERQEDCGINFSFTQSINEQRDSEEQRPMQLHVPRDDYSENFDNYDDRPYTANSQDTYQQAEGLFQDFDGTHYAPSMISRYNSLREASGASGFPVEDPNRSSMLKALPEESVTSLVPPPPEDGMVYYPAPVPRMLNLPQKISQAPSATIMNQRKTQVINALPDDARRSAYWLPQAPGAGPVPEPNARASKLNLAALPPQLRASVFFDPGSQRKDIEIRDQSAVRTLDDLLDASALAPVSAFTDHPIVGKTNVYKKSQVPRASTVDLLPPQAAYKKERKGSFLGFGRRSSVGSENALDRGRSVSPGRPLTFDDSALARGPNGELLAGQAGHSGRTSPELDPNGVYGDLRDPDASDEDGGVPLEDEEESEDEVGAPTTLLAELELRKREQKNRNRTAYNTFPDGMHATLLELDDVAQLQKSKRKKQRVALAWEDPALKAMDDANERDDEDVPLGVLYANDKAVQQRIKEQDLAEGRPLGLMEKKELEDNEPLSKRIMRLRGINPNMMRAPPSVAIMNPEGEEESESEHEGETLGQRMKRLRDKKALDDAIGDVGSRPISEAFSIDVLSQLGVEPKEKDAAKNGRKTPDALHNRNVSGGSAPKSPGGGLLPPSRSNATTPGETSEEEETLGQRRARLQREREAAAAQSNMQRRASGLSIPTLNPNARLSSMNLATQSTMNLNGAQANGMAPTPSKTPPPLQKRLSMADILAAYPTGKNDARKVSNDMLVASAPQGSLLAQDASTMAARKERMRMSSAEMLGPTRPGMERGQSYMTQMTGVSGMSGGSGGLMGMVPANGGGGMYVNQQQMYGMWSQQQNAMLSMHMQGYGYPTSTYGMPSPNYGMQQHNPMSIYGGMMGGASSNGYQPSVYGGGMNGYTGPMATGMGQQEGFIDPKTRSRVDAWRQSVMP